MKTQQATILIIDDSLEDRETYRRYLLADDRYTYKIFEEESGEDGLHSCKSVNPDVILLDYLLPDLDGLEFVDELKQIVREDRYPIIMLTGQGSEEVAVKAMKSGVQDYLVKGKLTSESLRLAVHNVIAQANLKRQLKESEERFRTSIENMLDCFGIYTSIRDKSGKIIDFRVEYMNAAATQTNQLEVLPAFKEMGLFEEYCQVVETGKPLEKEAKLYSKRFGQQYLEAAFDLRVSKLGDGFVASWRKITSAKRAEERLRLLESVVVNANDAVVITGAISIDEPEPRILYVNEAFTRITGYTAEEVVGSSPRFLQGEKTDPATLKKIRAALEAKETITVELISYRKDGSQYWIETSITPVANEQGEYTHFVAIQRDITERKQVLSALRQSESRFRRLVESNIIGVIFVSMSGKVIDANDAFLNTVGYRREDLEAGNINWKKITPPEYEQLDQQKAEEILNTGVCTPFEKEYIRPDRTPVPILLAGAMLEGSDDIAVCFVLDLTERKRAERERDRLLKLEQAARAEAEAANRAKDEFVSMVSHDLRTPLNAIQGWASILRVSQNKPEMLDKGLETIERNAKAQGKLLEDLLDVSRMTQGKLEIYRRPIALVSVIEEAISTVYPIAKEKEIILKSEIDLTVQNISGDPDRLKQVLGNLLSNAIKFTPERGLISVKLKQIDSMVQITVSDTGEGISPEFLPHIFDRFSQAEGGSKKKGLGLGLAIARYLVQLHGGTIEVDSTLGRGTTFTIQLPCQ